MNRPLCTDERRVLEALLRLDVRDAETLRHQLPHASVTGACDCGCGTVELVVDRDAAAPVSPNGHGPRPEASAFDENGRPVGGVILHLEDGYMDVLEIYSFGRRPLAEWPPDGALQLELHDE